MIFEIIILLILLFVIIKFKDFKYNKEIKEGKILCICTNVYNLNSEKRKLLYEFIFKKAKKFLVVGNNDKLPFDLKDIDKVVEDTKTEEFQKIKKMHGEFFWFYRKGEMTQETINDFIEQYKNKKIIPFESKYDLKNIYYILDSCLTQANVYNIDKSILEYFTEEKDLYKRKFDLLTDCEFFFYDANKILADFDAHNIANEIKIYLTKEEIEEFKKIRYKF